MERGPETGEAVDGKNLYSAGGERNVRRLAVEGTQKVEDGVHLIEELLRETRRVGRNLRLRYHARDRRFEWRLRVRREPKAGESWSDYTWAIIGGRVPPEVRKDLRQKTLGRVDGIERWMVMRQDGRAVMHLVSWLTEWGLKWPTKLVELLWEREDGGRVTWTFRLDGRLRRQGNWRTPEWPTGKYPSEMDCFGSVDGEDGKWRRVTGMVQRFLVGEMERVDERLAELAAELRARQGAVRLYRHVRLDSWGLQVMYGMRGADHLPLAEVAEKVGGVQAGERAVIIEAGELLERRQGLRRILRVIAELTAAGAVWPGGRWRIRGYDGKGCSSVWVVSADETGIVGRGYGDGEGRLDTFEGINDGNGAESDEG